MRLNPIKVIMVEVGYDVFMKMTVKQYNIYKEAIKCYPSKAKA